MVASHSPPTADLACNPGMCPDQEPNWQPFGSPFEAGAQSTEPYHPGLILIIFNCTVQCHCYVAAGVILISMYLEFFFKGTPRATTESFEDGLKYPKQIKRESPPIRAFEGAITKGKPYDGITTIKEMGRSIHEIPRQDILTQESRKTPEVVQSTRPIIEGSISQVIGSWFFLVVILL